MHVNVSVKIHLYPYITHNPKHTHHKREDAHLCGSAVVELDALLVRHCVFGETRFLVAELPVDR